MQAHAIPLVMLILAGTATAADAGPFGGFAHDSSTYLSAGDRLCRPVAIARMGAKDNTPAVCSKAAADAIARAKVTMGTAHAGPKARYTASASGTSLTIRDTQLGTDLVTWSATDPITRVIAVYTSSDSKLIAVEYEARMFGKARELVMGFRLPLVQRAPQPRADQVKTLKKLTPAEDKALAKALVKARAQAKRRRHKAAAAWFRKALVIDADHPEARYGVAAALAGMRKYPAAIAELETLAKSSHPRAIVFLIEARTARVFASQRANPAFRKATFLTAMAGRKVSAYERVVGVGGKWEQTGQTCDKAWVNLHLVRLPKQTFRIRIKSRCNGQDDIMRLGGMWDITGADTMSLRFPNPGKADEVVACRLTRCSDGSGEDCMRCPIDRDLVVDFRTVRR